MSDTTTLSGRELDGRVARSLFGWLLDGNPGCCNGVPLSDNLLRTIPHYSTDGNAALQVLDKLRSLRWWVTFHVQLNGEVETALYRDWMNQEGADHVAWGKTLPEAVCRAALEAVKARMP